MRPRMLAVVLVTAALVVACGAVGGQSDDRRPSIATDGWSVMTALPSPDGERVAFIGSSGGIDLGRWQLVLAGGDPVELSPAGTAARSFAWFPSGDTILLAYADEMSGELPTRFAIVDLDGQVLREIPVDVELNASYGLAVSPDETTALFPANEPGPLATEGDLWSLDLESGHATIIHPEGEVPGAQERPVYRDDTTAVLGAGELLSAAGTNGWIGVVDVASGELRRLTPNGQTANVPSLSPDGRYAVYDAFPGNERSKRALWYVPLDGSEPPQVLIEDLPGRAPALEPTGRSVLVVDAGSPGDGSQIRRIEIPEDAPWLSD